MECMVLLESDKIKLKILNSLLKNTNELSMNGLRKKIGAVNYNSVKRNCEFLEKFELIKIEQKNVEHKTYNFITITTKGVEMLNKFNNKK